MCGRFSLAKNARQVEDRFPAFIVIDKLAPRYNIAPAQPIAIFRAGRPPFMDIVQWGLIPPWAKDQAIASPCINARAETAAEKPAFRSAFHRKRCLIPADGWFEWPRGTTRSPRHPVWFHRRDHRPFAFAGLWEEWHDREGGLLMTAAILTVPASPFFRSFHTRMPAMIPQPLQDAWLSDETTKTADLHAILRHTPSDSFTLRRVSSRVNSVAHDDPACLIETRPAAEQADLFL